MKKFLLASLTTLVLMAALSIGYLNFGTSSATTDPELVAGGPSTGAGVPICICDDFNKKR